ncbi:MAG: metalloregulator ArsR/SmtB family transcription factor [Candidatus Omnitrophota bacterium]
MTGKYPFDEAARMLKVVAHPARMEIICLLEGKTLTVKEIQALADIKQSMASQHLGALTGKGILSREKKGNEVYYSIKKHEVLKLMSCIRGCCGANTK